MEIRITDAENFFNSVPVPTESIQLNQCAKIVDPEKFISSHLKTVRAYAGAPICLPYLKRLEQLRTIIQPNHG